MSLQEPSSRTLPVASVVICAHNSHEGRLQQTLDGLKAQGLPVSQWELILVDNASTEPLADRVDLAWHPAGRVVVEHQLGLTPARLRGFAEARGELIVFVDDDNVLGPDYLAIAIKAFESDETLGVAGGRSIPVYETEPPTWLKETGLKLGCRDFGDEKQQDGWAHVAPGERVYPWFSPVGAGMIVRRAALEVYAGQVNEDPRRRALDRTGNSLVSGGDNDIVMTVLDEGWTVAYLPQLRLDHLIPGGRLQPEYLARLSEASYRSWILVLDLHGVRPWKPLSPAVVPLLKVRHYFRQRAWRGPLGHIKWRGVCGQLAGRAMLR